MFIFIPFGVEPSPVTSLCNTCVWVRGAWVNVAFQAEAWHHDEVWRQQLKFENDKESWALRAD